MVQQDEQPMALTGLKVLDLAAFFGPYATQLFADLGLMSSRLKTRMVVMIPDAGDRLTRKRDGVAEMPLIFLHATAIKDRSLLILPVKLGRICCAIFAKADIIVENFRPEVEKYGLDYGVAAINPGSSLSNRIWQPSHNRPGYDFNSGMG